MYIAVIPKPISHKFFVIELNIRNIEKQNNMNLQENNMNEGTYLLNCTRTKLWKAMWDTSTVPEEN